ncbi:hypothetical protein WICANDRAFT_27879 [Wickerhamomyces anomalus NRRL Y-366-8]|uniref:Peptidase S8/S53 domain-containing protein n=1 Tax=Wickerhamomyces anomalus (strain ATCC 58044 / CBS 1984 / NCYC 433 / NRRL Y-366-8) TaxID=683960 RepID=A0A1E3P7X4_WICAA|nr:uncharacterized protein WICANDRAFT_27879 [Wickerhamomyces anomalus NRRL Y-366-8]ODQ61521.1 hypothetical protein WICANDRAFT_27879 [Wickerhamomyces anomalus NRRL Y-366-8]
MGLFKGIMGEFNADMINSLYYDKNIASISIDRELVLAEVQENAPKHLARLSQKEALKNNQKFDFVYDPSGGIGVDVYILDSGIHALHSDFSRRVTKIADFTGEGGGQEDSVGHGSYMAGVIGSETYGVAKKSNLFDVKVTDKKGRTKLSAVIGALSLILADSKVTNRPTLVVVPLIMKKNAILNGAIESLVKEGIPVIVPAGNDGKQSCNYSPASAKGALTVGSIDVETDSIASFSNWGACVDVFAPGTNIKTTSNHKNEVVTKSGTSLSTGITAGLVAYFMGMGDSGKEAVQRVIQYSNADSIPEESLNFKPLTANRIVFNCEGNPNWGPSF